MSSYGAVVSSVEYSTYNGRFFPGFSTWGCNRVTGVQAKLGPTGGLWFGDVTSLLGRLTPNGESGNGSILRTRSPVNSDHYWQKVPVNN
jgi:hypothetical protein